MKQLESADLGTQPINFGAPTGRLEVYSGLETPFSADTIVLSPHHVEQIEAYVSEAAEAYQFEPTYVQQELGLPSLVVRADCTIGSDGNVVFYEMEDSPSGLGVSDIFHKEAGGDGIKPIVIDHYKETVGDIPTVIVSGARSHGTDDELIVGPERYIHDTSMSLGRKALDNLVIVKAIPGKPETCEPYLGLQKQALAPMTTEGDKQYLKKLGQAAPLIDGAEGLLRDQGGALRSQALKASLGSMSMGVSIFLTPDDRRRFGKRGIVTSSKLIAQADALQATSGGFVESFVPPLQFENEGKTTNAILRIFVLLGRDTTANSISAKVIGGAYVSRPELIVHGASNAVSGAVLVG